MIIWLWYDKNVLKIDDDNDDDDGDIKCYDDDDDMAIINDDDDDMRRWSLGHGRAIPSLMVPPASSPMRLTLTRVSW